MNSSGSNLLIKKPTSLGDLLQWATNNELTILVNTLCSQKNDRYFHDSTARERILSCYQRGELHKAADSIASEVRALGSSTVMSTFRGGSSVTYDEVVRDVATELKIKVGKAAAAPEMERQILDAVCRLAVEEKCVDGSQDLECQGQGANDLVILNWALKRAGLQSPKTGVVGYFKPLLLPSAITSQSGLFATGAALAAVGLRAIPAVGIGMGVVSAGSMAYTVFKRTSPDMSVIVPLVVQIALVRRRVIREMREAYLNRLRSCL